MKLGTQLIGEHRIEIEVHDNGTFEAEFDGQNYTEKTKAELVASLTRAVKKAKRQGLVDVTVLGVVAAKPDKWNRKPDDPYEAGDGVLNAKLRAAHERQHGTFLLVSDDKAKQRFKVGSYSRDFKVARRLTLAEAKHYLELRAAATAAAKAVEDFEDEVRIDMRQALAAARSKGGDE